MFRECEANARERSREESNLVIQDMSPALAAIIVPETDDDIVANYVTLAERAKVWEFGLLEDDVVVLDTETTGLDFKECELIEVAAARLRGREIVDTFDLFVKPVKPIPAEIVQITGIDNDMVKDAEDAATVVSKLIEFVGDAPIIAHNATFDRHFIEKGNSGGKLPNKWIDSLELSRIVLPCLSSHKLHDLSRAFDLHQSTHRAIDDVIATCGLWRILLTAGADLPAGLLNELAEFYPEVEWSYRDIFRQLAAAHPGEGFSLRDERADRCARINLTPRPDANDLAEEGPLRFPTADEIADGFSKDGIIGRMYGGYEYRSEQVLMSTEVCQAFKSSGCAVVEAGTGVGKSISYLLPSVLLAQKNNITVGVATKSNALTDQLINHELPLLSSVMDRPVTYTALKGFDNYPCLRKVDRLFRIGRGAKGSEEAAGGSAKAPEASEDLLNALAAIATYGVQSAFGDLNCLGIRWGKLQRSDFSSASSECQKRRCPYFPGKCFLHLARRRAASCDVVVTNHSLLFRQVGSDIAVLPPIRYWIVDEAHSAAPEARRQWAMRVNSREVTAAFDLVGGSTTGALGNLFKLTRGSSAQTLVMGLLTKMSSEFARAYLQSGELFAAVKAFCQKQSRGKKKSQYETESVWVNQQVRESEEFANIVETGTAFAEALEKAIKVARESSKTIVENSAGNQNLVDCVGELGNAVGDLACVLEATRLIVDGTDLRYVYSVLATQRTGFESYELVAERLDVGEQLAEEWYPEVSSVVYSSATIAVGDKFDHFNHEVGLDRASEHPYRNLKLASSYDYDSNMKIIVVEGLPDPSKQKESYLQGLAPLLTDVHLAMDGSVLTLFTSRVEMDRMFELVQPEVAKHGLSLMSQARGGNVRRLCEHFVAETNSSLFALKSFWEGFDAPGDTLRCVVIPKLPFNPPTEPLSQERNLREGSVAWRNHDLPESVITMKQAIGRLIRSFSDKGVLVLADPRLTTMWYGKIFLSSLPKKDYAKVKFDRVADEIAAWRRVR